MTRCLGGLLVGLWPSLTFAATYTVTNTNNGGTGSLRWAIQQANANPGPDLIRFAAALDGQTIQPTTPLPQVTDPQTVINGDITDNGAPHVAIDGSLLTSGAGLRVEADECGVVGLAIHSCPGNGLVFRRVREGYVMRCHLGFDLAGTAPRRNRGHDLLLDTSHDCTIGEMAQRDRNVIAGGNSASLKSGIYLRRAQRNLILSNHIGLRRDGRGDLGEVGGIGITIEGGAGLSRANQIGNDTGAGNNFFGWLTQGVRLDTGSSGTILVGNLFGLTRDGESVVPIVHECVYVYNSGGNVIGRPLADARNIFAGQADTGVYLMGAETRDNTIQGNYFGLNAMGTEQRRLRRCIHVGLNCGAQTIGGPGLARNFFAPRWTDPLQTRGIEFLGGGSGSVVRNNFFGYCATFLPAAKRMNYSIDVGGADVRIVENIFTACTYGIRAQSDGTTVRVFRNRFVDCSLAAVALHSGAQGLLGNLGNASTTDDGGNIFEAAPWHIRNETPLNVRAEGNDFGTTVRSKIDAHIYDKQDDASLGRVDFDPLAGGVSPTGETGRVLVSGLAAIPTGAGAEIAFTLSAPGEVSVTILNLAGRPVARVAQDRAMGGGLQRLAWNGQTLNGTRAPAGTYLVSVEVRAATGTSTRAMTRLGR